MKKTTLLLIAVTITLGIRITLLTTAPGIAYEAYETLNHVEHIQNTGLPQTNDPHAWGGSSTTTLPLFHYLLAFFGLFMSNELLVLIIPNLIISLTPITVYLLTTEITKNRYAQTIATLASTTTPLLYNNLTNAQPITLATPLFLLSTYYFLRIGKTPREQTPFIIAIIALALTSPTALLLAAGMILTLILLHIQKTRLPKSMAEATIFTVFLTVWTNVITYNHNLQDHGISTLWMNTTTTLTIPTIATLVGVLALTGATISAHHYLRKEKNTAIHALTAISIATITALLLKIIPFNTGILLLSLLFVTMSAGAIELLINAKHRSKLPTLHTLGHIILLIAYLTTATFPAIGYGLTGLPATPTNQEQDIIENLFRIPIEQTILWDAQKGSYLEYHGHNTAYNDKPREHPRGTIITQELEQAKNETSEFRILETLNKYDITTLILPSEHNKTLTTRCFMPIYQNEEWEVFRIRCVVQ